MTEQERARVSDRLEQFIYERLGHDEFGDGQPHPPGDGLSIRVGEPERHTDGTVKPTYVICTKNDGFELWIGSDRKWYWHCRWPEARRLAVFILWDWWAVGTWCGLRRRLWYAALSRRVRRHERRMAEARARRGA